MVKGNVGGLELVSNSGKGSREGWEEGNLKVIKAWAKTKGQVRAKPLAEGWGEGI
jgi:hypothetical protein